jgi:beta-lactam-binding protein with PASTA domain
MTAEEKRHRFWKRVIILAIAWIFVPPLIALVVFGVIGLRAANTPVASQPQVPSLKGLQIETAQKTGHQAGFQVELAGKDFDSGEKPGTVINQEPWAGSAYPAGATISVLIAEKHPNADFWEEQRRIHQDYEKRGFFKDFDRKKGANSHTPNLNRITP